MTDSFKGYHHKYIKVILNDEYDRKTATLIRICLKDYPNNFFNALNYIIIIRVDKHKNHQSKFVTENV